MDLFNERSLLFGQAKEGNIDGLRKQIIANATVIFPHAEAPQYTSLPHEYVVVVAYKQSKPTQRYFARLLCVKDNMYEKHKEVAQGSPSESLTCALQNLLQVTAVAVEETRERWQGSVQRLTSEEAKRVPGGFVHASVMPQLR